MANSYNIFVKTHKFPAAISITIIEISALHSGTGSTVFLQM